MSNSWGGPSHFSVVDGNFLKLPEPGLAIENAVTKGRDGLGTVFTWAGGNARKETNKELPKEEQRGRNVNSGNYDNNRHVISDSVPKDGVQNFIFTDDNNESNLVLNESNLVLKGRDKGDLIDGNDSENTLIGNGGNDELFAKDGDDFLSGNAGDDYLDGEGGNDILFGGKDRDYLSGNEGNDSLSGDKGFDTLYGDEDNDTLSGGEDDDQLFGEEGDDNLSGDGGSDTLEGGSGNDNLNGGIGNDELRGENGNDTLIGGRGADSLYGGADDDSYILEAATSGGSLIEDYGGTDTLVIEGETLVIDFTPGQIGVKRDGDGKFKSELRVDLNKNGTFDLSTDLRIIDFFNNLDPGKGFIETVGNLSGSDILQDFPLTGTAENDVLIGSQGDDKLDGLAGDDELYGHSGNDTLIGNLDNDFLEGDDPKLINDGANGLIFQGTPVGNDHLLGGDGDDTIFGGAGDDILNGGNDKDFASYVLALDGVYVDLNNGIAFDGLEGTDTLIGIENVFGSGKDDTLIGSAGNNILHATTGGADTLEAGFGNDTYRLHKETSGGSQILDEGGEDTLIITNIDIDEIDTERQGTKLIINLEPNGEINSNQTITILNYYATDVGDEPGAGFIEN